MHEAISLLVNIGVDPSWGRGYGGSKPLNNFAWEGPKDKVSPIINCYESV